MLAAVVAVVRRPGRLQQPGRRAEPAGRAAAPVAAVAVDRSAFTIAMITHEAPGDTFWDKVRAGAEQAAKNTGVELKYSNNPDGARAGHAGAERDRQQGRRDRRHPDPGRRGRPGRAEGRARPASRPSPSTPASPSTRSTASRMYFGSDEDVAGQAVGQRLTQDGGTGKAHLRDHRAGQRRAGGPLRRGEEDLPEHREPLRQRHRPAVGAGRPSGRSCSRTRRSAPSSRSAPRSRSPPSRPRPTRAARPRSSRST